MALSKDVIMQNMQRFGGAMYTPVILFAFFGLTVAVSIVCKNTGLLGSIAAQGTVWYDFWYVVEQGAWTVFAQMPILFAIAVPIGFAKKEPARCAMESFVIYMLFNYFIAGFLTLHADMFGVDYSQAAGPGTGLAMIANVKTLDMGMLGAIFIACCTPSSPACRTPMPILRPISGAEWTSVSAFPSATAFESTAFNFVLTGALGCISMLTQK